ncbi:MAG: ankyrin repeat domain-containing protein [bacterium]|nr:ankyrin repeat domain-containing protein [bacterium]
MSKSSHELMHRYLAGIASEEEVRELEARLFVDDQLQDEFLFQAELDAHLRQEAQSNSSLDPALSHRVEDSAGSNASRNFVWKCLTGISCLVATVLLMFLILSAPITRQAMAVPLLGKLPTGVSWTERNIWFAAATDNLPVLEAELKRGVSIDVRSEEAYTPLHVASVFGQTAAVELLLSQNADVSLADNEGNTALHMAVFLGRTDVVRALLAHGADPHARNSAGFSSIDCAGAPLSSVYEDQLRRAEAEMKIPLDINRIRSQRLTILKLLVGSDRASDQGPEATCILNAAITGDVKAIQKCLTDGENLNETEQVGGNTPLMLAATFGNREAASLLITAGADLETRNKSGGTALHQACFFAQPEIVELLLDAGADSTVVNSYGVTPLALAPQQMDTDWQAVYEYTYQSLNLNLNFEAISQAHARIRELFQQRSSKIGKS